MSRQEALQQFRQALKAGQKCYRECVHRGRYPYPQVLEERLRGCAVAGRVDLGVLDIPIAQIIGTNTAGRQAAFAGLVLGSLTAAMPDTGCRYFV